MVNRICALPAVAARLTVLGLRFQAQGLDAWGRGVAPTMPCAAR
ncbi:hypothetical protein ACQW02_07215 [Humitalea sp. 24SJ18S-53]